MSDTTQTTRLAPASSETLLTLLEALPGALFVVDDATTIVYANASAQAMLGATREDVLGKPLWRGAPQLASTALYQAVQQTRQTRTPTEVEYVSPVKETWLHVQLSPTVGGLMLQVHQGRAAARREAPVPQGERLCINDLNGLFGRIGVLTPEGIVLEINEVPLADAQIRREEVIGRPMAEAPWWSFSPVSQEQLCAAIARANRGETVRFEALLRSREGMIRSFEEVITPHLDANHHIAYLVIAGIDITERKCAEAELHALIDAIPQLVWTTQPDGFHDLFNQRWHDYTGQSTAEARGEGWRQCLHPEDRQRVRSAWQRAVQSGGVYETELRLRQSTTGEYRWFLARAMPVRDETGQIIKWFGTSTDIEEQKQAEQKLKASEENLRVLAETVPQLVWTTQPDGSVTYWNQQWYVYTGSSPEQTLGEEWSQFLHPDDSQHTLMVWHHALETGNPYEVEYRLREGQTGAYRWFLARGLPVRDDAGQIIKWFGTCTDIEDRKQAEQQLKESRESLRVLTETVPQMVWGVRPDGRHDYMNQRWQDYTGFTLEHMHQRWQDYTGFTLEHMHQRWTHLQFIHPDDQEASRAHWQHALDTGDMFEHEERIRNGQTGEYRWFLVRAMPVRDEETGQIVKWFGTCTDIEDQKRTEEALRQNQERMRALINSNIIGITSTEMEGEVLIDANEAFLCMTGYTREEVQSRTLSRVNVVPPEQAQLFDRSIQELTACGQTTPFETELVCKDGSRLPVLVGGVIFQGHPRQMVSFTLDNSARKELEQRKDDFISMASHELRNPLTALKLQTTLLHRQLTKQGIQAPALSRMETQINKVTRLVEELLDVSKIQAGSLEYLREPVDLDTLLREIADTMQYTHPSHRILVRGSVQTSLIGDPDRLGQVFINLLSNAIKYSPGAQTVEMDLSASEEAVTIRVRDHGLGIPREQRDKIFERFYRAAGPRKRAIPGLGMGLYIVAEIVKHHGGTITVDSAVGEGSTFTATLPTRREA